MSLVVTTLMVTYKLCRHAGKIDEGSVEADHTEGVTDTNQEKQGVGQQGEVHHFLDDLQDSSLCVNLHNLLVSLLCYGRQGEVTVDQAPSGIIKIFSKFRTAVFSVYWSPVDADKTLLVRS